MSNAKKNAPKADTVVEPKPVVETKPAVETSAPAVTPAPKVKAKFVGSKNAIRNTLRRHEEVSEVSPTHFTDNKSKLAIVLGPEAIICKDANDKEIGKVSYGKSQFNNTAMLVNSKGGAMIIRGGGGGGAAAGPNGNTSMKSLKTVLASNGFATHESGAMVKGDHSVLLSDKGWALVGKDGKTIKNGEYGRGVMKSIKDVVSPVES
jgi:hypothetical protein